MIKSFAAAALAATTAAAVLALLIGIQGCRFDASPGTTATVDTTAGDVPFELAGPGGAALVVPVHVNRSGPFEFVLDTGATLTCINENLVDSLGLPEQASQIGFGAGVQSAGRVRLVAVDSFRVGNAGAFDLTACVLDLDTFEQAGLQIDGLVGLNFLREFRIKLDFEREVVRFEP